MIDTISRSHWKELLEESSPHCVSIFMPTHRSGPQTLQDPIRLKNLLRKVGQDLSAMGFRSSDSEKLLGDVSALVEDYQSWQHQCDGLAWFVSPRFSRSFRLPVEFPELAIVADRFHLKPLLPLLAGGGRFYVLALSQNRVCLFRGTRESMTEQLLDGVPKRLSEAVGSAPPSTQLQYHTTSAEGVGHRPAIFHGQGADVASEANLRHYFRQIDRGLCELLHDEQAPLILAAVEYLVPVYRETNHYASLLDDFLRGNPDHLNPEQLHSQAWPVVDAHFRKTEERALTQYKELAGTQRASNDLSEVVRTANEGRIAILFVALGVQCWGTWDGEMHRVDLHTTRLPGDEDLLNLAAIRAYLSGGTVFALSPDLMPDSQPAAAIYRY
jgi:Bacterial archaeo-eukaryotic release factor family 3